MCSLVFSSPFVSHEMTGEEGMQEINSDRMEEEVDHGGGGGGGGGGAAPAAGRSSTVPPAPRRRDLWDPPPSEGNTKSHCNFGVSCILIIDQEIDFVLIRLICIRFVPIRPYFIAEIVT